ncbi:cytochrome P450 [Xylogone sp. PMI_703]|nr:cytochrome P450 [Xylogone sp. PMI_703]
MISSSLALLGPNDSWAFALLGWVVIALLVVVAKLCGQGAKSKYPLPPGPKGSPILGNVRQVPAERPDLQFAKWAKEYNSDVIYLNFMGQPVIVLNSLQAATDLLDKKGAIYSDRSPFAMLEALGFRHSLTFTPDGAKFRKLRKEYGNYLSMRNSLTYRDTQLRHAHEMVRDMEKSPQKWLNYLSMFSTRVVYSMAFAIDIVDEHDHYVKLADRVAWIVSNMGNNGITILDILPWATILRHIPPWLSKFIPSVKYVQDHGPTIREFLERPIDEVVRNMKAGKSEPSFIGRLIEARERHRAEGNEDTKSFTDEELKGTGGTLYAAGQDTTHATLTIFVLAMVLNPEVQRRAQRDIDAVTGGRRLPNFDDWKAIPIIERIVHETLRFHQAVPNGIPHRTTKDDVYRGMYIPKNEQSNRVLGSMVIANSWAMLHDPDVYQDPFKFNPDRFVPASEGGAGEPLPAGQFGFGRRVCPGQHLGLASLWIVVATMLAKFDILPTKDADGNDILPALEFTTGVTRYDTLFKPLPEGRTWLTQFPESSHPAPFSCNITPRNNL